MYKPVQYEDRECMWCGNVYTPNRKDKMFCSDLCYKRHGKKHKKHSNGNKENQKLYKRPYIKHKKLCCEMCGFIPTHPCQLDIHHIDGNHFNNVEDNLQTLCANCHRLETANQLGWL